MSLKLPRHLTAWETQLRIFPDDIALALGPLMQRLSALIGEFPHHHGMGNSVPDGFAGLNKRGHYERLVASDWMLADELPDEFLRRSVMGEHLFWKFAYLEPSESRSTLALFDAGPEQLGAPRILHLAALAVLEARARRAGAAFCWGILQSPEADLMPGMNVAEVNSLLHARGAFTALPDHFASWARRLTGAESPAERWVVGSERLLGFMPPEFSSLLVSEMPPPHTEKLRAEVRPAGKHPRAIELELPSSRACAQLLRDPFFIASAPRQTISTGEEARGLLLSPTGNRLWIKTQQGGLLSVGVPNSPRQDPGRVKTFETLRSSPPVAIGKLGRSTIVVSMDMVSHTLRVRTFGGFPLKGLGDGDVHDGDYELDPDVFKPLFSVNSISPCVWHPVANRKPGLYLVDESGQLLRLSTSANGRSCEVVHRHTLALTRCRLGMCYLTFDGENNSLGVSIADHDPLQSWHSEVAPIATFLGHGPTEETAVYGQVAFGFSKTSWEIHTLKGKNSISVPEDFSVHGVIQEQNYESALIVLEGDRRTLSLLGAHGARKLCQAGSQVTAVSTSSDSLLIAYSTLEGNICVFSVRDRVELVSWRTDAP